MSGSRMELAVYVLELRLVHMGVDLRRRHVGMAQQLLNDAQIRPARQQVRCETVSQRVGRKTLFDPGQLRVLPHDPPDVAAIELPPGP